MLNIGPLKSAVLFLKTEPVVLGLDDQPSESRKGE